MRIMLMLFKGYYFMNVSNLRKRLWETKIDDKFFGLYKNSTTRIRFFMGYRFEVFLSPSNDIYDSSGFYWIFQNN